MQNKSFRYVLSVEDKVTRVFGDQYCKYQYHDGWNDFQLYSPNAKFIVNDISNLLLDIERKRARFPANQLYLREVTMMKGAEHESQGKCLARKIYLDKPQLISDQSTFRHLWKREIFQEKYHLLANWIYRERFPEASRILAKQTENPLEIIYQLALAKREHGFYCQTVVILHNQLAGEGIGHLIPYLEENEDWDLKYEIFYNACINGLVDTAGFLIKHCQNKIINSTVIENSCCRGQLKIISLLIKYFPQEVQECADQAFRNAGKGGHWKIMQLLQDYLTPDHKINLLTICLIDACRIGRLDTVQYLVPIGADISVDNYAPYSIACRKNHHQIGQFLLNQVLSF